MAKKFFVFIWRSNADPNLSVCKEFATSEEVETFLLGEGEFEWVTLTSQATVQMLAYRLASARQVHSKVAAIGDGTAAAFRRWAGRRPDLQPATFTTAALARAFPRGTGRVLCARADIAPAGLEDALAAKGWSPTRVDAYRTRFPRSLPLEARRELEAGSVDAITFTSASSVRGFVGAIGAMGAMSAVRGDPRVVCIGSVTAAEARTRGLKVAAVAKPHTMDGIVEALERVFAPRKMSTGKMSTKKMSK
jgi:uroporphyrinogen-III synthase